MKKPLVLLVLIALLPGPGLFAQSPTPTATPCPSANPFPPCPLGLGWAENLPKYTDPATPFPTGDTESICAVDCNFHQWSWEAFVWATAIGTDGRARFATLPNSDELGKKPAAAKGPKPLGLKPRDLKPKGGRAQSSGDSDVQAGGGMVVDQHGQIVWYSVHMNQTYFEFLQQYSGAGYAQASPTQNFPIGAAIFKASWRVVPDGEDATKFYTEKATVPLLVNAPCGGIMVDPSGKTRSVTVALVGLHVVGRTPHHPEFLWGTFEHERNAPNLRANTKPTDPVSEENFTFYAANTPMNACNQQPLLKVMDVAKQTIAPVTNIYRLSPTGGATPPQRVKDIESINKGARQEMASMGKLKPPQSKDAVFANYHLVGTLWLPPDSLTYTNPNILPDGVGSVNLANSTLETFFQGDGQSCFMCHNPSGPAGAKNINLSHAVLNSIPVPTPTPGGSPTPTCTPVTALPSAAPPKVAASPPPTPTPAK